MVIVAGYMRVFGDADAYLELCVDVVRQARGTQGWLDFALSPDLLEDSRVNIYERWLSRNHLEGFRRDGLTGEQAALIRELHVAEYDVGETRSLSG